MSADSLKASVIIPVRDGAATLSKCLAALTTQVAAGGVEVIVVDNGSTDESVAVASTWGARVLSCPEPRSSYAARNAGIRAASAPVLAFTDADCVPEPRWIESGLAALRDNPVAGAVCGPIVVPPPENWYQRALWRRKSQAAEISLAHPFRPYGQTANLFVRREVFDRVGLFETNWISGGDADLCWRMQIETDFKLMLALDAPVVHLHRDSLASVLRQRVRWGFGMALLEKKYERQMREMPVAMRTLGITRLPSRLANIPFDGLLFGAWFIGLIAGRIAGRLSR